jgi:Trypsin
MKEGDVMRRLFVLVAALIGTLAIAVAPGSAVTGNFVDDFEHPYVGLVVFYDADGEFLWRCSGSLLTPTVLLTAGHCTDQDAEVSPVSARVYFQQDAGANYDPATGLDPVTGYPETCAAGTLGVTCATSDELYDFGFDDFAGFPNTQDVGLVILDQPIALPEYGSLAAPGTLDPLATERGRQDVTFTVSGYGLSYTNPVFTVSYRSRLMAETTLVNLNSANAGGFNIQLSSAPASGRGGTCFGDSGGPVFLGGFESDVIVGVNSFVLNNNCAGVGFGYRVDSAEVQEWIESIIGEEEFAKIDIV